MDGFTPFPRTRALFDEDFDRAEGAPGPEVIEPKFSVAEVKEAREAAWHDGHAAGLEEAAAGSAASIERTIALISGKLTEERDAARQDAERHAEAIARLLLDSLATAFPELCARHGDQEVRAIIGIVLTGLMQEPAITIRAHPRTVRAVAPEIARVDPDLAARVSAIECDEMTPGDVRVTWHNGAATRDAGLLWEQVSAALLPIKETVDGG